MSKQSLAKAIEENHRLVEERDLLRKCKAHIEENAALRAVLGELTDPRNSLHLFPEMDCYFCGSRADFFGDEEGKDILVAAHAPDCPVGRARKLLGGGE